MRKFFIDQLEKLQLRTGLLQYAKIKEACNTEMQFKARMGDLMDDLCKTCDRYGNIPDKRKQYIIDRAVLRDENFKGFNSKWLEGILQKYWVTQGRIEYEAEVRRQEAEEHAKEVAANPISPEKLSELKAKAFKNMEEFEEKQPYKGRGTKMREALGITEKDIKAFNDLEKSQHKKDLRN